MEYIHQPDNPPTLDPGSVISILISADFLQMARLVQLCLEYLKRNVNEVVRPPHQSLHPDRASGPRVSEKCRVAL